MEANFGTISDVENSPKIVGSTTSQLVNQHLSNESTGHGRWAQGISLSANAPKDHPGGQGCVSRHGCSKDLYVEDEVGQEDQAEQVLKFLKIVKI